MWPRSPPTTATPARPDRAGRGRNVAGNEPDYRFTLANERTFLAWIRTALGLLAGGIAISQLVPDLEPAWLRTLISIAAIVASLVVTVGAYLRWAAVQRSVRLGEPLPPTRLIPFLVAGVALVGLFGLVAVITD